MLVQTKSALHRFEILIAALRSIFSRTSIGQNNGVTQLTGVASRYIGDCTVGFYLYPVVAGEVNII